VCLEHLKQAREGGRTARLAAEGRRDEMAEQERSVYGALVVARREGEANIQKYISQDLFFLLWSWNFKWEF